MTPVSGLRREGDTILLDPGGRVRLRLGPEGRPVTAQIGDRREVPTFADGPDSTSAAFEAHGAPDREAAPVRMRRMFPVKLLFSITYHGPIDL